MLLFIHVIDQFTYLLDVVSVYHCLVLNDFGGDFGVHVFVCLSVVYFCLCSFVYFARLPGESEKAGSIPL